MPRYYTICETTEGVQKSHKSAARYLRIYAASPEGFLFHDTEHTLDFSDVQKALWRLSELYEGANKIIALRVDDQTIMATFNTCALPRPVRMRETQAFDAETVEYLASTELSGWLLENIKDPTAQPIAVEYNSLYSSCLMLERLMDCCPCTRLSEGTCLPQTAYLQYPWLAKDVTNYSAIETPKLRTKRFSTVDDFSYISGQYATSSDFTKAVRPWSDYDFSLVEERLATFAERGQNLSHRAVHRKVECSKCTFSVKKHTSEYTDCGFITQCTTHVTEDQAWAVLFDWLENDTAFIHGDDGFTPREINYLISIAGRKEDSRAISPTRNVPTYFAGFHSSYRTDRTLLYKIVAARGALNRHRYYPTYTSLRADYPMLPARGAIPEIKLEPKILLAQAIFSQWQYIKRSSGGWGNQNYPVWRVELSHGELSTYGRTTARWFYGPTLRVASAVDEFVRARGPGDIVTISDKFKQLKR